MGTKGAGEVYRFTSECFQLSVAVRHTPFPPSPPPSLLPVRSPGGLYFRMFPALSVTVRHTPSHSLPPSSVPQVGFTSECFQLSMTVCLTPSLPRPSPGGLYFRMFPAECGCPSHPLPLPSLPRPSPGGLYFRMFPALSVTVRLTPSPVRHQVGFTSECFQLSVTVPSHSLPRPSPGGTHADQQGVPALPGPRRSPAVLQRLAGRAGGGRRGSCRLDVPDDEELINVEGTKIKLSGKVIKVGRDV